MLCMHSVSNFLPKAFVFPLKKFAIQMSHMFFICWFFSKKYKHLKSSCDSLCEKTLDYSLRYRRDLYLAFANSHASACMHSRIDSPKVYVRARL